MSGRRSGRSLAHLTDGRGLGAPAASGPLPPGSLHGFTAPGSRRWELLGEAYFAASSFTTGKFRPSAAEAKGTGRSSGKPGGSELPRSHLQAICKSSPPTHWNLRPRKCALMSTEVPALPGEPQQGVVPGLVPPAPTCRICGTDAFLTFKIFAPAVYPGGGARLRAGSVSYSCSNCGHARSHAVPPGWSPPGWDWYA